MANGLIYHLLEMKLLPAFVCLIASYLQNTRSRLICLGAGVPQGSVLAPHLFNMYLASIPRLTGVDVQHYADDNSAWTSSYTSEAAARKLQRYIRHLETWMCRWCIRANAFKTQLILFNRRRRSIHHDPRNLSIRIWCETVHPQRQAD